MIADEVRQVLIQITQTIRIPAQTLVRRPQNIPHSSVPKLLQVHYVKRRDVVWFVSEQILPVPLAPELEPEGVRIAVAEGDVAVHFPLKVELPKLRLG